MDATLKEYKCPNCSGKLEFDTKSQKLKCPYCDGTFDPEIFELSNEYKVEASTFNETDEFNHYICKTCGGEVITDKETIASSCPYCDNPLVISDSISGDYKPAKVIPFKYDKKQAIQKYKEHLSGKYLLPKKFSSDATLNEIKGIYVPFWTFDGKANANIHYNATKTRYYVSGDYDVVETSHYKLFRSGSVSFKDVPVDASSKVDDDLTQSIEPFDKKEAKDFNSNYLAGYLADRYNVSAEDSRPIASSRIINSTRSLFDSTTAFYDTCTPVSEDVYISNGYQEYDLFPIWLLNVKYNDKNYKFAMNGQTGKFVGDLPMDTKKLILTLLFTFIGVFVLITFLFYLGLGI